LITHDHFVFAERERLSDIAIDAIVGGELKRGD